MKTIKERAREAAWQIFEETILSEHSVDRVSEIIEEKINEQKAIDDAECINQIFMGRGSTINHNEANYQQGYHDAIEKAKTAFNKACGWLSTFLWYNEVFEKFMKNLEE